MESKLSLSVMLRKYSHYNLKSSYILKQSYCPKCIITWDSVVKYSNSLSGGAEAVCLWNIQQYKITLTQLLLCNQSGRMLSCICMLPFRTLSLSPSFNMKLNLFTVWPSAVCCHASVFQAHVWPISRHITGWEHWQLHPTRWVIFMPSCKKTCGLHNSCWVRSCKLGHEMPTGD